MAGIPISQLPSASLPLSGNELVPLVQSGVTSETPLKNMFPTTINQVAYNAANFTVFGGTWSVSGANQLAFWYLQLGKLMLVNFHIFGGTLSGVSNATYVSIAIPNGAVAANNAFGHMIGTSGSVTAVNTCQVGTNSTTISCYAPASGSSTTWALGPITVAGQIFFQVL